MNKNTERPIDVIVAGHICLDLIPTFPGTGVDYQELFSPGKLVKVSELVTSTGGPVSNTGLALKKLGIKVALMGKVGTDFIGDGIISRLREEGLDEGMRIVVGESSSYTIAIAPPGIDRMFLHNPGANDTFGFADVDFDLVEKARVFHLGYPPLMERMYSDDGREMMDIFWKAKELGTTTSLDVALPDPTSPAGKVDWRIILKNVLPWVDIYLPSLEETLYMLDRDAFFKKKEQAGKSDMLDFFTPDEVSALADELLQMGPPIVGLKAGHRGFYLRTSTKEHLEKIGVAKPGNFNTWVERELWSPSFHVEKFAGATGSGDSAIAGFLAAYLRGLSIETTLQYATAVGANNVTAPDALSGIKDWETTTQQIKDGWAHNPLELDQFPGWRLDEDYGIWLGPGDKSK
ncbi:carbohydrate kinase family protein [Candidatus Sumerlaeota bacterium]|nr:carbohydrate kinase family protein [Candidatus Sumerlaeota bacterium]